MSTIGKNRTLTVSVKEYYGRVTIIPECSVSRGFCDLLGQKNLTMSDVEKIKLLGYTVVTQGKTL